MCSIDSWMKEINWRLVISVSKALLTPVVALFAVWIARQQWKTNTYKVKLDVFDRRFRVFEETRNILGAMSTVGADIDVILDFWTKTAEAEFLFGAEIKKCRKEICDRATIQANAKEEIIAAVNSGGYQEDHPKAVEVRRDGVNWASSEMERLAERFKKYLDLSKL